MKLLVLSGLISVVLVTGTSFGASDSSALIALHQEILDAHLSSNVDAILKDESHDYVVSSHGEVTRPTKDERRQLLGPYLRATNFEVYRDEMDPVVRVSNDGTLGWLTAQVYARGTQTTSSGEVQPIEFTSSWIELYEKRNGRWIRIGNVSNFKP